MKFSPESRNENRTLQMIMSKSLAKSTEVTAIVLLSMLETSIVYQRSCVLYESSLCCSSLTNSFRAFGCFYLLSYISQN